MLVWSRVSWANGHSPDQANGTDGKWVTDDYYEDESLAKCPEQGFTPYAPALEEDIIANALSLMQPQGRPPTNPNAAHHDSSMAVAGVGGARSAMNLTPFYTLGGPTTQFAGNGADPWSEAGWGIKRAKLRTWGVTEEDWMLRTAEECRRIDGMLRELREDRLEVLEGKDAEAWVHYRWNATEEAKEPESTGPMEGPNGDVGDGALRPPLPDRKRSGLSQEVIPKEEEDADGDVEMSAEPDTMAVEPKNSQDATEQREMPEGATPGGSIIVQKPDEEAAMRTKWNCGFGSLKPGVVKAVYEVGFPVGSQRAALIGWCSPIRIYPTSRCSRSPRRLPLSKRRHIPSSRRSQTRSSATLCSLQLAVAQRRVLPLSSTYSSRAQFRVTFPAKCSSPQKMRGCTCQSGTGGVPCCRRSARRCLKSGSGDCRKCRTQKNGRGRPGGASSNRGSLKRASRESTRDIACATSVGQNRIHLV